MWEDNGDSKLMDQAEEFVAQNHSCVLTTQGKSIRYEVEKIIAFLLIGARMDQKNKK